MSEKISLWGVIKSLLPLIAGSFFIIVGALSLNAPLDKFQSMNPTALAIIVFGMCIWHMDDIWRIKKRLKALEEANNDKQSN